MSVNLVELQNENDCRWKSAKIMRSGFDKVAAKAEANKSRYIDIVHRCVERESNMPDEAWVFIAVIHERESDMDFTTHLGQGDPLNRRTVHVPAGRGPFTGLDAFEQGAVDALIDCAPYAALSNKDWSISGMLTYLERYNGLGYATRGIASPYLWAGTNQYSKGKYVRDGVEVRDDHARRHRVESVDVPITDPARTVVDCFRYRCRAQKSDLALPLHETG